MAEPIDLDKLSVALTASVLSAQRYLHQANQELQDLYEGSEALAGLARPSFTLGDVTFDVPFVVDAVQTPEAVTPPEVRVTKDVVLNENDLASLKRGASPQAVDQLATLLADYSQVKTQLRTAASTQAAPRDLLFAPTPRLAPMVNLTIPIKGELQTGAARSAVSKFEQLLEDYDAARTSLVRIKEVISGGSLPRLAVRVDAESVEKAAPTNLHRLTLRISAEDRQAVKVQGQTIT